MSNNSGTGTGNGNGNNVTFIQPSPPDAALDQHQQQQVMLGQGGNHSPLTMGVGAQGYGPPAAAPRANARGLVAALQKLVNADTPDSIKAAFNKQLSVQNAYSGAKATQFMEEAAFTTDLMVLAYLPSNAVNFIKLAWGVTSYKNNDPNNDVPDGTIAFIGDIDGNGSFPPAVTLPPTNAVQWVKVKAPISRDDYESEYVEGSDSRELRVLPNGRENNHIPRMLHVPPRVALFLTTQPRRHHELYYYLKRLVADNASGVEQSHVELMLDWCVAASFQYNKTTGKQFSLLKLDMASILSDFPAFVAWKQQQVNTWLGSPSAASTTAAQAGAGAATSGTTQITTPQATGSTDIQLLATMMMDQQKSAMEMTERMLQNQREMFMTTQRNQGGSSASSAVNFANLKAMQGAELFALMYYCSVNDPDKIPPIWTVLYSNETVLEKRQQLRAGVIAWSVSKANRVVNKIIHFEEHFFDNCKKMNPGCNEIKASYLMLDRGMSPQSCLQVTLQYIQEQIMLESAADAASGNLTLTETKSLSTKEARKPPTDPKEIRSAIHTFCGLISTMFGEDNDLYAKWEMFGNIMEDEAVHAQEAAYTKLMIMQYWLYAVDTTRRYFYGPATRKEFNQLGGPNFPKCIMDGSFWTAILNAQPWPTASFPSQWTKFVNGGVATNTTNSNSGGGRNSNSNNNNNNNRNSNNNGNNRSNNSNSNGGGSSSDWKSKLHPMQLEVWGEYHNKVGGRVYLNEMCTEGGITIGQLPFLNRYMVQRGEQSDNKLCYKSIIGECSWPGCIFDHPTKQELDGSEEKRFLNKLNKVLKAGRDKIAREGPPSPPPRRHTGKRGRYR